MSSDHTNVAVSVLSFVCMHAGQTDMRAATVQTIMMSADMSTGMRAADIQADRDTGNRAAKQTCNRTVIAWLHGCVRGCVYVRRVEMETYMHTYGPASMCAWSGKRSAAKK